MYKTEVFITKDRPNCFECKTKGGCEKITMSTRGAANVLIVNIKLGAKKRKVRLEIQPNLCIRPPFLDAKSDSQACRNCYEQTAMFWWR
jgi:hypothetical protein